MNPLIEKIGKSEVVLSSMRSVTKKILPSSHTSSSSSSAHESAPPRIPTSPHKSTKLVNPRNKTRCENKNRLQGCGQDHRQEVTPLCQRGSQSLPRDIQLRSSKTYQNLTSKNPRKSIISSKRTGEPLRQIRDRRYAYSTRHNHLTIYQSRRRSVQALARHRKKETNEVGRYKKLTNTNSCQPKCLKTRSIQIRLLACVFSLKLIHKV